MSDTIVIPIPAADPVVHCGDIGQVTAYVANDDDRAVTRELLLGLVTDHGLTHIHLEGICEGLAEGTREQRRRLRNQLRRKAGIPDDGDRRYEQLQEQAQARADQTSPWQLCGHDGCATFPVDPATGAPARSTVRKWFCAQHVAEQSDRDRLPLAPRLALSPSGGFIDVDEQEVEEARGRAAQASRQAREQAQLAEAEIAAAEHRAYEQARREQFTRELPPVYRGIGA
jgi:hypothetical protein